MIDGEDHRTQRRLCQSEKKNLYHVKPLRFGVHLLKRLCLITLQDLATVFPNKGSFPSGRKLLIIWFLHISEYGYLPQAMVQ